jgi:hypothetical protein
MTFDFNDDANLDPFEKEANARVISQIKLGPPKITRPFGTRRLLRKIARNKKSAHNQGVESFIGKCTIGLHQRVTHSDSWVNLGSTVSNETYAEVHMLLFFAARKAHLVMRTLEVTYDGTHHTESGDFVLLSATFDVS